MDDSKATLMGWFLAQKEAGLAVSIIVRDQPTEPNMGFIGAVGVDYVEHLVHAKDGTRACAIPFDALLSAVPLNKAETAEVLEVMGETRLGEVLPAAEGTVN